MLCMCCVLLYPLECNSLKQQKGATGLGFDRGVLVVEGVGAEEVEHGRDHGEDVFVAGGAEVFLGGWCLVDGGKVVGGADVVRSRVNESVLRGVVVKVDEEAGKTSEVRHREELREEVRRVELRGYPEASDSGYVVAVASVVANTKVTEVNVLRVGRDFRVVRGGEGGHVVDEDGYWHHLAMFKAEEERSTGRKLVQPDGFICGRSSSDEFSFEC